MEGPETPAMERLLFDAETTALRQRLRLGLLLCLGPIVLFAIFDLFLAEPGLLALYYALKLLAVAVVIGAFVLLRRTRNRGTVVAVGLGSIAVFYGLSTASAILAREPLTTPILTVAVSLGTATLLPWGVVPQLVVALIAALSTVASVYGATGSLMPLLQYPTVGVALGLGVSVYVAFEFERSRRLLARRYADQARAEAEVRQLNEVLEARVAARTAELQRSEASLSALIENATDAIWSIDRTYRMIAFNSVAAGRFRELFGDSLSLERDFDERTYEHFARHWQADYDRGLAGERFSVEKAIEMPAGTRHYHVSFNPIISDGVVTGLAIFSTDITDRLRAEAEARQHQAELTHVLRLSTMGEMAAGLAHEINQPLAAIVNYAQGCARRLRADPDVDAVVPVIDDIAAEAMRAAEIIRRLRTLVRKEAPLQDWMDLDEIVANAVRLLEPEAHDHGVTIRVSSGAPAPPLVGDCIQIEQVMINLLRNGIDAMAGVRGRRELTVEIRRQGDQVVELSVSDTGAGLPPTVAEHVFDPFFSTKAGGLGMGLSISRTIIESHQGRLWATSNPSGGATFHFTLPLTAPIALATAM